MRSDHISRHMEVLNKRKELAKPEHQFYNYNVFKNINLYKDLHEENKNNAFVQDFEHDCTTLKRKHGEDNTANGTTPENSEEICADIAMEILDKMFVEDATENKHVDEHDCTTAKRKREEIVMDKSVNGDFIIHCGQYNLKVHMERKNYNTQEDMNQQTEPSKETVQCNNLVEAVEVWKIYKLLQRMKNK